MMLGSTSPNDVSAPKSTATPRRKGPARSGEAHERNSSVSEAVMSRRCCTTLPGILGFNSSKNLAQKGTVAGATATQRVSTQAAPGLSVRTGHPRVASSKPNGLPEAGGRAEGLGTEEI